MRQVILGFVTLGSLIASTAAHATAPTWCEGYTPKPSDAHAGWAAGSLGTEGFTYKTLNLMARAAYDKPDDPARQGEMDEWKRQYAALALATDADWECTGPA